MKLKLQECGCISLPDEVLSGLGLAAGAEFEFAYEERTRTITLTAPVGDDDGIGWRVGSACPVGTEK